MKNQTTIKKLEKYNLTKFQKKVLIATMSIKKGETRSYKEIAEQIGSPNAYRAVGSALKKNPLTIEIPCHRVIKSGGLLGNYSGKSGREGKYRLLHAEGAI
jgi:methylated-DNA-[protein]-cysteine S-methyltransferase